MTDENHTKNEGIIRQLSTSDLQGLRQMYDKWSDNYDQDLLGMQSSYTHPEKIAALAAEYVTDKSARILDVCAGTGLGGMALRSLGFVNIDAIDASPAMLAKAADKGIYGSLYEEMIGTDRVHSVQDESYDALVTSGSFLPAHLGPAHLRPLSRVLRSGGHFVMALREEYLSTDYLKELEPEMTRMERDGVWRKLNWREMEHYYNDKLGKAYVYQKL